MQGWGDDEEEGDDDQDPHDPGVGCNDSQVVGNSLENRELINLDLICRLITKMGFDTTHTLTKNFSKGPRLPKRLISNI